MERRNGHANEVAKMDRKKELGVRERAARIALRHPKLRQFQLVLIRARIFNAGNRLLGMNDDVDMLQNFLSR